MDLIFTTKKAQNLSFPFFSMNHIIPLIIIVISIMSFLHFKGHIKKRAHVYKKIIGGIILSQQIFLYTWYVIGRTAILTEALPLYICRVITLFIVISFLFNQPQFHSIIFYLGSIGSVIALLLPDTSGYLFPHIMYDQFFITHGLMLVSVFFIYHIEGFKPTLFELQKVLIFIISYTVIISFVNSGLHANYGYLEVPPASARFLHVLPPGLLYKFILTIIMMLLPCLVHLFEAWCQRLGLGRAIVPLSSDQMLDS